jgi:RND superfamily putative drug exporter
MFERLGHAVYHRRWLVIGLWALLLLVTLPFAPIAGHVLKGGGFANGVSESDRGSAILVQDLGFFPSNLTVIFSSPTLRATDPRFVAAMRAALAPARHLPDVLRIDTAADHSTMEQGARFISDDGHSAIAILQYDVSFDVIQNLVPQVRATIHSPILHVLVAGDGAVYGDMERLSGTDLETVERITFPIALVLLALIFGTLVAASVPIITGAVSVVTTLAIIYGLGHLTDLSIFSLNVTTMIGLGVGIDYSLFVVSRFREEIRVYPVEEAVARAVGHAGRAVLFSGITVMIGLSGLLIFHAMALRSIGLGGGLVVLVSVLAALTLLPALLSVLGPRIDALPVAPWRLGNESHFWRALAQRVMRHPWRVIVAVLAIILVMATPFRLLKMNVPDATILPRSVQSRQGYDLLNQQFNQQQDNPVIVVVTAPDDILAPAHMAAVYDYVHRVMRDPSIDDGAIQSIVTFAPFATKDTYTHLQLYLANPSVAVAVHAFVGHNATYIAFPPRPGQTSAQMQSLVRRTRAVPLGGGLTRYVTGFDAGVMDYLNNLYSQFPLCIGFVVVITYLVLLVLLRSALLPLKAVLMNALSLVGAYGAVVWIFQQGHLSSLFNFSPTGYIDEITPIIMFCTLFGLSMDYEVFLLSRMREHYLATHDNAASVARGLERTGRIITSAALILVVVAGSFSFTNLVLVKAVGLGLAIAILLDASLVRCLLVPATMRVLGDWNWWLPSFSLRSARPPTGTHTKPAGSQNVA